MANEAAFRQLQEMIDRAKSLNTAPEDIAPDVAKALRAELEANIASGVGPDKKPWQKTQEGKTPLRNAARALEVVAEGPVVIATLTGVEARHHKGDVKGKVKRPILPNGRNISPAIVKIIRDLFLDKIRGF